MYRWLKAPLRSALAARAASSRSGSKPISETSAQHLKHVREFLQAGFRVPDGMNDWLEPVGPNNLRDPVPDKLRISPHCSQNHNPILPNDPWRLPTSRSSQQLRAGAFLGLACIPD
jgi:hypothetical protein